MLRDLGLAALVLLGGVIPPQTEAAPPQPLAIERFGLCVFADDLDRSARFYAALLGRPPQTRLPHLIGFDVNGAFLAIADRRQYAPDLARGGGVSAYLKVRDLQAWFSHAAAIEGARLLSDGVAVEGAFSHFKIADPEGAIIEFYAVSSRP